MITFSQFLEAAQFTEDDFSRVLRAFERRMPKLLGTTIYRDGGSGGVKKIGNGEVYQWYFDDRSFQVRAKGGHVYGIDVWSKYTIDKGPDYTIDVHELNSATLLTAMATLAKLIKSPSEGEVKVAGVASVESAPITEMAKRVDSVGFWDLMKRAYGSGATNVTWEQIKQVADDNDVLIPNYIRAQKIGRGRWNADPNAGGSAPHPAAPSSAHQFSDAEAEAPTPDAEPEVAAPAAEPAAKVAGKKDPIYYIKVTAQDPDSKRFIPAGNDPGAQRIYKQLQSAVERPTEAEIKDPDTLYGHLAQLVSMACKGSLRSLLIYGGPGTGKTYTIMKTINEMGMVKGKDYVKLSGKASPVEIYKTLFMYRDGGMVVFDDLDSMWRNEDATNILKAALDTSPIREISWVSAQTINVSKMDDNRKQVLFAQIDRALNGEEEPPEEVDDEGDDEGSDEDAPKKRGKKKEKAAPAPDKIKYPSSFDFTGRVVFISNLKKEEFDTAILSRSAKINMDLTPAQVLERMKKILPTLGGDDVPIDQKQELLDHLLIMHKSGQIDAVTMREFTKGLDIVRSGAPNWKDLIQYA